MSQTLPQQQLHRDSHQHARALVGATASPLEKRLLRVLHLEDDPGDAELVWASLRHSEFECHVVAAQGKAQFEQALADEQFDLILSDYALPDYDGLAALKLAQEIQPATPFILVSGTLGEEAAVESLKAGAADYVLKTRLARLAGSVQRALREAEARRQSQRIQHELRMREEAFRALTDNSPDTITRLDRDLRFVYCNPAAERSIGKKITELIGKTWTEAGLAAQPEWEEGLRRVLETGSEAILDFQVHTPAGRRFVEARLAPERDDNGIVRFVLAVTRDLTRIHVATEELRERLVLQERLTKIAATVPGIIYTFRQRPAGSFCMPYASPTIDEFCGVRAEDLVADASPILQRIHPDDQAPVRASIAESARTMTPWRQEFRLNHPRRGYFWMEGQSTPEGEADGGVLWHGFMCDVTERKQVEQALRESEESHRLLFENCYDAIVVVKVMDARFIKANPAALKIFGAKSEAEFCNFGPGDLSPERQPDGRLSAEVAREMCQTTMRDGSHSFEWLHRRHSGEEFPALVSLARMEVGGQLLVLSTIRDITERKRAEAELARAQAELIAASRQAGMAEVATGILHNVGNVLNSVNVSSTVITDRIKKSKASSLVRVADLIQQHPDDLGEFMSSDPKGKQLPAFIAQLATHLVSEQRGILGELDQLKKNVEHIKDIVTMQQGFAKLSGLNERVNVVDLLEDALLMNATALHHPSIRIVKEFAPAPLISTQKHKVLQILVNLIRNGQHACEDSGRDDQQMTLRILHETNRVCISVRDNGVGIPPENLPRIFNHGFTTKKNGHGFGLHSGALAAKEMGGALQVQSAGAGHGATFTLELPTSVPEVAP